MSLLPKNDYHMAELKVMFLQNYFLHYRVDFYEELAKYFDVIVAHCGTRLDTKIKQTILEKKNCLNLSIIPDLDNVINEESPDVIVSMFDLHYPQYIFTKSFRGRRQIFWGLDNGSSSYIDFIKKILINTLQKPVVFYSETVSDRWKTQINVPTIVAQNSVLIEPRYVCYNLSRVRFINVGALAKRKRNDLLLKAYEMLPKRIKNATRITLVGEGSERLYLEKLAHDLKIAHKVDFLGHIEDREILSNLYNTSIASISLGQAGLAVVKSIGFGVPFITHRTAITGGEIYGVIPNKTGYLLQEKYEDANLISELRNVLEDAWQKRKNYKNYSNIRKWYECYNSIPIMTEPFAKLIKGVR